MQIHEYGKSDGIPVVFLFGTPQRGDAGAEIDELASHHGIRLICPTRPWYDNEAVAPSFEAVTRPILHYLAQSRITSAFALGGSGGGPFALHLAMHGAPVIVDCTLFASMGLPESFVKHVSSPPTLELLKQFESRDYQGWKAACSRWGLPPDLAHGAWGDFKVLFDSLPQMERNTSQRIYVYHSQSDPNAPVESVQDLLADASNVVWHIDESASHIAIAQDKTDSLIGKIFQAVHLRSS